MMTTRMTKNATIRRRRQRRRLLCRLGWHRWEDVLGIQARQACVRTNRHAIICDARR